MAKKRKTRQEKIILQLKRELARLDSHQARQAKTHRPPVSASTKSKPRQGAISPRDQPQLKQKAVKKKNDVSILFYHPRLVKRDLLKTFILALIIFSLEFVLYWRLR